MLCLNKQRQPSEIACIEDGRAENPKKLGHATLRITKQAGATFGDSEYDQAAGRRIRNVVRLPMIQRLTEFIGQITISLHCY